METVADSVLEAYKVYLLAGVVTVDEFRKACGVAAQAFNDLAAFLTPIADTAAAAFYRSPDQVLAELFPSITTRVEHCPDRECVGFTAHLSTLIQHLNDAHEWSREAIADWLDGLDVDLVAVPAGIGR